MNDNLIRNSQIRTLRRRGIGPREIARQLNISPSVVAGVLHRADMSIVPTGRGHALKPDVVEAMRRDRRQGATFEAIGHLHGVSIRTAHNYCRDVTPC